MTHTYARTGEPSGFTWLGPITWLQHFLSVQSFLRTNKFKYLVFVLAIFSIFILNGGRQTMAIMSFVFILFLIIDRKVKSRLFLAFLGIAGGFALFILFRDIFEALIMQSKSDASIREEYIRITAARYYLDGVQFQ